MRISPKGNMTRRAFSSGSVLGALAAGPVAAAAQTAAISSDPGTPNPGAASVLAGLRAEHPIPALSAAVVRNGDLVWHEAQGIASVELGVPAAPQHLFRLGSVSKVVTVAIGARLAQAGLVDLDAPISTYRADLPDHHRATCLRQLYNHQGGVRHYGAQDFDVSAPGGMIDFRIFRDLDEALALFIADPLVADPGTSVSYSTFGYTLISAVLERATGKSFHDLVREEVTSPLMLDELRLEELLQPTPGRVAEYDPPALYARIMPVPEIPVLKSIMANPAYKWAGGGMLGSARDVARFGAAHLSNTYLRSETLNGLFTPVTQAIERMPALGLGWRIDRSETLGQRFHHAGNMQGCRAQLVLYPDHGLSVALLSNLGGTPGNILDYAERIAGNFAG